MQPLGASDDLGRVTGHPGAAETTITPTPLPGRGVGKTTVTRYTRLR